MCLDIESMISFCRNGWQRRIDELPLWPRCSERPGYCGCCALSCRVVQERLPWGRCIPCAQRLFRSTSGDKANWGKAFPLFSLFGKEDIHAVATSTIDMWAVAGYRILGDAAKWYDPEKLDIKLNINYSTLYSSELGIVPGSFLLTSILVFYCYTNQYIFLVLFQTPLYFQTC